MKEKLFRVALWIACFIVGLCIGASIDSATAQDYPAQKYMMPTDHVLILTATTESIAQTIAAVNGFKTRTACMAAANAWLAKNQHIYRKSAICAPEYL